MRKYCKDSNIHSLKYDFDGTEYVNRFKKDFLTKWNKEIQALYSKKEVTDDLEALFDHNDRLSLQKTLLFRIVSSIEDLDENKCMIQASKLAALIHRIVIDEYLQFNMKVAIMRDLSVLELSLIIAMKHHNDIYDGDPFNFEIILTRLHKFQNSGDFQTGPTDRAVVLKAFDVLKVSLICSLRFSTNSNSSYNSHSFLIIFSAFGINCTIRKQFKRIKRISNVSTTNTKFTY